MFAKVVTLLIGSLLVAGVCSGDSISWAPLKGTLEKEAFDASTVTASFPSESGGNAVTLTLRHGGTAEGLYTYSKWEIDRWGDPTGEHFAEGSWQVVSNEVNDVVLGLWGYWGWTGLPGDPRTAPNDETDYELTLTFDRPAHALSVPLNGINGFLKPENGYNSRDELLVKGYLDDVLQAGPVFDSVGPAVHVDGKRLLGNFGHQINHPVSGQHTSDDGSVMVRFEEPVDRVVLTLSNVATHPVAAQFQDESQTWSYSIGELVFENAPPLPLETPNVPSFNPALDQFGVFALSTTNYPAGLNVRSSGDGVALHFERAVGLDRMIKYEVELSADFEGWTLHEIASEPELMGDLERLTLNSLDQWRPDLTERGFARLKMSSLADSAIVTRSETVGWYVTKFERGFQTHGLSLNRAPVHFTHVTGVNGEDLTLNFAPTNALDPVRDYYLEVTSGPLEGHRLEVVSVSANHVTLDVQSPRSTLKELVADLIGAAIVMREHWQIGDVYDPSAFHAGAVPNHSDQLLFFNDQGYEAHVLIPSTGRSQWALLGQTALTDTSNRVINPGEGLFICRAPEESLSVRVVGHVRTNVFRQPLRQGYNLVSEGYPFSSSPLERGLNDFDGSSSPSDADHFQRWVPDADGMTGSYADYFCFQIAETSYWTSTIDESLTDVSEEILFIKDRALFLRLRSGRPNYLMNFPVE